MNFKLARLLLGFLAFSPIIAVAQRGKDLNYTVTVSNDIVNTYTSLTLNANAGSTSINVASNTLSGEQFTGNLTAGDLILIVQMQGASMDIDISNTTYTRPAAYIWDPIWTQSNAKVAEWGKITNYNNAGKHELVEVLSIDANDPSEINLSCPLQNTYSAAGHTQIIRVPRFNNLTVNTANSITAPAWNGVTGGVVAIEVNGDLNLNGTAKIQTTGKGFRGGVTTSTIAALVTPITPAIQSSASIPINCSPHTNGAGNGGTQIGSARGEEGGRKGEGIGGYETEYFALYSGYATGSPANGGGGGGYKNAGGGGGSNIGTGTYTGKGVPSTAYAAGYWNIELAGFATSSSSGGGRGGHSQSNSNQNALTVPPNNSAWCSGTSDGRKESGGLGGHPLVYDVTRMFMGGGGGAGDQDNNQGGSGGAGGGIVFIQSYGTITGTGTIEANGAVGLNSNPTGQPTSFSENKKGHDGAGGGGAGGMVIIKNSSALPATIAISANGGAGGNQNITLLNAFITSEASGPGGGGAGGGIAYVSGSPAQTVSGGANGTTNSSHLSEFIANGATNGASGISDNLITTYNITASNQTICSGSSVTLTATTTGTLPGPLSWYTAQFGGTSLTSTTVSPTVTTTYYVGVCPGSFRVPVVVTVNPQPTISGTAILTNPTCSGAGSITGLTVSGGTPTYTYSWNGTATPGMNYSNIPSGTYNLIVTDANGCTAASGPHTLVGTSGPIINATAAVITNQNCNGTLGSITGITATGTGLSYLWSNSGGSAISATGLLAGSYTLTVTDGNGCSATSGPHVVSFVTGPIVNSTAVIVQNPTCGNNNGSITGITATGSSLSYSWSPSGGVGLNASLLAAGNYTLTVTDGNGCTASSGPHTLLAVPVPTINTSAVSVINENCSLGNGSVSGLVINGGTPTITYAWTNTTQTSLSLSNLSAGSYALTVTDGNGCTATSGPYTILNTGGPSLNTANVVIQNQSCNGTLGSVTGITATGVSLTYAWTNSGGSSLNATNLVAGTYSLTVTDGNGCSTVSSPYTIEAPIPLSIDASNMLVVPTGCAANTGSITGIIVTGGINPIYSWTNSSATVLDLSNLAAGAYTLSVTDDQGCTDNLNVNITVMNAPTISTATMLVNDEHCNQADGTISGIMVNGGTPGYSYSWNTTPPTLSANLSNLVSGTYTLTVTDAAGCTDSETVSINEVGGPTINLNSALVVQPTCTVNGSISGVTVIGANPFSYSWEGTTQTTLDITNLTAGSYKLTVTDINGCQAIGTDMVLIAPAGPSIDFVWSPTEPNIGETVVFTNTSTGTGLTNPIWTIEGQNLTTTDITHVFTVAGSYEVTLMEQDVNGCIGTSTQIVVVYDELDIPNVITANNDNVNDNFEIAGLKPNTQVIILNRWGEVVFTSDNYLNDWGGKDVSGQLLKDGVYTYSLMTQEGKKYHGFIHLLR